MFKVPSDAQLYVDVFQDNIKVYQNDQMIKLYQRRSTTKGIWCKSVFNIYQ